MEIKSIDIKINNKIYSVIACSIMGQGKIENQDSFNIYNDDRQIIITVADGLGSAKFSKEGSSKIVDIAVNFLKNKTIESDSLCYDIRNKWKEQLEGNISCYDTTLKFIKITDKEIIFGGIGDGWIAMDLDNNYMSLESNNIFTNQTDSILSINLNKKFLIKNVPTSKNELLLIATDGFSEDIEKKNSQEFLHDIFQQIESNKKLFINDIKETLENWPIETNKDDKTVVFIFKKEE